MTGGLGPWVGGCDEGTDRMLLCIVYGVCTEYGALWDKEAEDGVAWAGEGGIIMQHSSACLAISCCRCR